MIEDSIINLNNDERRALEWIRYQEYSDIQPIYDDPPDFVVDNRYAVEVTRLERKLKFEDGSTEGVEKNRISLARCIENLLEKLRPNNNERSWAIDCEYDIKEPLPNPKVLRNELQHALTPLIESYDYPIVISKLRSIDSAKHAEEYFNLSPLHICLKCGICLELTECQGSPSRFFLLNVSDGHGIGIAQELAVSVKHSIQYKSKKITDADKWKNYEEWWLILVDHICHSIINEREKSVIQNQQYGEHSWSRIVIISSNYINYRGENDLVIRTGLDCHDELSCS